MKRVLVRLALAAYAVALVVHLTQLIPMILN